MCLGVWGCSVSLCFLPAPLPVRPQIQDLSLLSPRARGTFCPVILVVSPSSHVRSLAPFQSLSPFSACPHRGILPPLSESPVLIPSWPLFPSDFPILVPLSPSQSPLSPTEFPVSQSLDSKSPFPTSAPDSSQSFICRLSSVPFIPISVLCPHLSPQCPSQF